MFRTRRELLLISPFVPTLLAAPQSGKTNFKWYEKNPPSWNTEDKNFLLNRSAWAREVPMEVDRSAAGMNKGPADAGGLSTQLKVVVRWESALPLRLVRGNAPTSAPEPAQYVLSISRLPVDLTVIGSKTGAASQDQNGRKAEVAKLLVAGTSLLRAGKDPLKPTKAEWFDEYLASRVMISFAAADQPIQLDDREVTFLARINDTSIRARFQLKDMVYRGKLEV